MGEVYLAEHNVLKRRYAVKILKRKFQRDRVISKRFQREALAASRLEHPNIVYISDFGRMADGTPYLAMEYIKGISLASAIDNALPRVLPLHRSLSILSQVANAVATAHDSGVLHRDLKPENIMLRQEGTGREQVKILDFGLAKITVDMDPDATALTEKGVMFGTPSYMSPEQARGEPVDTRTDIYALGAIAFELLTGEPPFNGPSLGNLLLAKQTQDPPLTSVKRPRGFEPLPGELDELVTKCLKRSKDERPLRISEAARVLEACYQKICAETTGDTGSTVTTLEFQRLDPDSLVDSKSVPAVDGLATPGKVSAADSLTDTRPKGSSSSLGCDTSFVEIAPHKWRRVVAEAVGLAWLIKKHNQAPRQVDDLLEILEAHKKQIQELSGKLAKHMSRLHEMETNTREKTAQLRHRLIDLRLAHIEEKEKATPDRCRLMELEDGISQQERLMAEVYQKSRQLTAQPRGKVVAIETEIEKIQRNGLETEIHLLEILRREMPKELEEIKIEDIGREDIGREDVNRKDVNRQNSNRRKEHAALLQENPKAEIADSFQRMMNLLEG